MKFVHSKEWRTRKIKVQITSVNTGRKHVFFKMNSRPLTSFSNSLLIILSTNLCNAHLRRFMGSNINLFLLVVSTFVHKTALDCHLHWTGHLSYTYDRVCTLPDSICLKSRWAEWHTIIFFPVACLGAVMSATSNRCLKERSAPVVTLLCSLLLPSLGATSRVGVFPAGPASTGQPILPAERSYIKHVSVIAWTGFLRRLQLL